MAPDEPDPSEAVVRRRLRILKNVPTLIENRLRESPYPNVFPSDNA